MARARDRGALALVLHSHMPYVEGFGTWPFGEEWLWEAVATVYLPLLEVLEDAPVTVGLTPVLCDQLETLPGDAGERYRSFLRDVRTEVHIEDIAGLERTGESELAAELRRAATDYARGDGAFEALGGDLVAALEHVAKGPAELWTSAATHPLLPLLATDAGLRLQLGAGIASHLRRFGDWGGGFWLPECAYMEGLERELADDGVKAFCVDQTDALGLGSLDQLEPVVTAAGPVAVPIDWATVGLVWDDEHGYPSHADYRDYHHRTIHDLRPWSNGGGAYDRERALVRAHEHARDFVQRCVARLDAYADERERPGLLCAAIDTELLGHWWYEGQAWLGGVLDEAHAAGLELVTLPDGLERVEPVERELAESSWGSPKDFSTWDAPGVAELAFTARAAELRTLRAAARPEAHHDSHAPALERAARELLALQASDWAFQATRELAADYPVERVRRHEAAHDAALAALRDSAPVPEPALRNLAPALDLAPLIAP